MTLAIDTVTLVATVRYQKENPGKPYSILPYLQCVLGNTGLQLGLVGGLLRLELLMEFLLK